MTLDLFLKEISSLDPPPDIVVYTGDNPPHDIWMESFAGQVEATQSLVEYVRQGLGNTTIYPALGNHGVCVRGVCGVCVCVCTCSVCACGVWCACVCVVCGVYL